MKTFGDYYMKTLFALAGTFAACGLVVSAQAGSTRPLTTAQVRAVIDPWYSQFTVATRGDVKTIQETIVSPDYQTCNGYLPGECWGRDNSIRAVSGLTKAIPDLKFEMKEMLISGDRVTVIGEVTGTPAGDLFGVPHSGKTFRMMIVDVQTIRNGKLVRTVHMENWLSALNQLRAK